MSTDTPPRVTENVWITMADGCSLAAKIWLPPDAEQNPVPAILEYIPYRKRDHKAVRDAEVHGFFARHGYVGARVDLRDGVDSDALREGDETQVGLSSCPSHARAR